MTANGPYIITTKRTHAITAAPGCDDLIVTSRRAVATLEEARRAAEDAIYRISGEYEDARFGVCESFYPVARELPESGGTIGTLPDGTVIEVAPRTIKQILVHDLNYAPWEPRDVQSILDAYNANQEADRAR